MKKKKAKKRQSPFLHHSASSKKDLRFAPASQTGADAVPSFSTKESTAFIVPDTDEEINCDSRQKTILLFAGFVRFHQNWLLSRKKCKSKLYFLRALAGRAPCLHFPVPDALPFSLRALVFIYDLFYYPFLFSSASRTVKFQKPLVKREKICYNTSRKTYRGVVQLVESRSPKPLVLGSSPSAPAKKSAFFRMRIFLSKPQAWHIIAARSVVYIIKGALRPCISSRASVHLPAA